MSQPQNPPSADRQPRNPSGRFLPGGGSENPGGRPRKLVEIEKMLDAEFRDVASTRENYQVLRKLALQGVTNDVFNKDGDCVGEKTTYHPAYMEQLFNRLYGPVKELEGIDLSNVSPEALAELREVLKQ